MGCAASSPSVDTVRKDLPDKTHVGRPSHQIPGESLGVEAGPTTPTTPAVPTRPQSTGTPTRALTTKKKVFHSIVDTLKRNINSHLASPGGSNNTSRHASVSPPSSRSASSASSHHGIRIRRKKSPKQPHLFSLSTEEDEGSKNPSRESSFLLPRPPSLHKTVELSTSSGGSSTHQQHLLLDAPTPSVGSSDDKENGSHHHQHGCSLPGSSSYNNDDGLLVTDVDNDDDVFGAHLMSQSTATTTQQALLGSSDEETPPLPLVDREDADDVPAPTSRLLRPPPAAERRKEEASDSSNYDSVGSRVCDGDGNVPFSSTTQAQDPSRSYKTTEHKSNIQIKHPKPSNNSSVVYYSDELGADSKISLIVSVENDDVEQALELLSCSDSGQSSRCDSPLVPASLSHPSSAASLHDHNHDQTTTVVTSSLPSSLVDPTSGKRSSAFNCPTTSSGGVHLNDESHVPHPRRLSRTNSSVSFTSASTPSSLAKGGSSSHQQQQETPPSGGAFEGAEDSQLLPGGVENNPSLLSSGEYGDDMLGVVMDRSHSASLATPRRRKVGAKKQPVWGDSVHLGV